MSGDRVADWELDDRLTRPPALGEPLLVGVVGEIGEHVKRRQQAPGRSHINGHSEPADRRNLREYGGCLSAGPGEGSGYDVHVPRS